MAFDKNHSLKEVTIMNNFFIITFIIVNLIGITYYTFLKETSNRKGKTKIKWKVILNKILQIEFESEHENNAKK